MRRIVACNSNLQELQIDGLGGGICAALQQLPGLTTLSLERLSDRHCSSLAQLTGLRALRVRDPDNLAMDGLRQLTALEQLTSLGFVKHLNPVKVPMAPYQMSATLPGCHCAIVNKAAVGSPPDVASQLRVMCNGPQNILAELQQLWAAEEY